MDPIQEIEVSNMDALTYDPVLRRSERNNSGIPPQRFGHDTADFIKDSFFSANNATIPVTFFDSMERN